MKAHPATRYVTASPETWSLIRAAYLSGLSAPTVAARFGVSVTALRRRAAREGWTKRLYAARNAPAVIGASADGVSDDGAPTEDSIVAGWTVPLRIHPSDLARKALAGAALALKAGEGLAAVRLARAANEIARLDQVIDWAEEDVAVSEREQEGRDAMYRTFIREQALNLAQDLVAGRELPPVYVELKAELARLTAIREADEAEQAAR
jgi:hypothetical protein